MTEIYLLAAVLTLASGLAILMRKIRLPLIVSYLLAGMLLSAFGLVRPEQLQFLSFLPEMGLAFLLFLVGMELDLGEFRSLGKSVLLAALGQVAITAIFLYLLWGNPVLALALSFSSTILVVKLLLEGKELASLHGKFSVGILLVEDLLAVLLLMGLSGGAGSVWWVVLRGLFLIWAAIFLGKRLLPGLFRLTAENTELLFLTGIGWCLLFVSLSLFLGFSLGVGAFLAGVSLAQSVYRSQISGRIKPLRDFFIMIFFIDLGASLSLSALSGAWWSALGLAAYVVLVRPAVFFGILTVSKFRVHTAFQTGILLSSISEFALIILVVAGKMGQVPTEILSPVVFAAVLSFIFSSVMVTHKGVIYAALKGGLKRLERPGAISVGFFPGEKLDFSQHAVLVGCHRSGQLILPVLKKIYGNNLIVVDFNPEVIEQLKNSFVPCLYGDVSDPEIAEMLALKQADLVVSTVRDLTDNLALLDALEKSQSKATVVITASDTKEAITLYERGAHHVSLPLLLEGGSIGRLIADHQGKLGDLAKDREKKLGELKRAEVHRA